jgi:predicted molibdopterin-dependent oxidoreductase YjgC
LFIEPLEEIILLPAQTRYEQEGGGTETTTERRIIFSPEIARAIGECRAEWRILRDLAATVDAEKARGLGCDSGPAIREEVARIVPIYDGIQRLRNTGDAVQYGGARLCEDGRFQTADGQAHFRSVPLPVPPSRDGLFAVSTRRGKQFNSLVYAEVDPLTGATRDAVFISPEDAARLHLAHGDQVALVNDVGRFEGRVFFAPIARGNLQIHWPEGNSIVRRGVVDATGGVPDYNARARLVRRPTNVPADSRPYGNIPHE